VSTRLALRLDLELVRGVPGLQGTEGGPEPTSSEAANPQVRPTSFFRTDFLDLVYW
jgi:hypothetical protein